MSGGIRITRHLLELAMLLLESVGASRYLDMPTLKRFLLLSALAGASNEETRLLRSILDGVDTATRPVTNPWDVVNVTLRMWVLHVLELDQVGENLTIATKYRLRWDVPIMTWNPLDHGNVTALHMQPTRIWTPDLVLRNTLAKEKIKFGASRDSLLADTPVVVSYDGKAEWRSPTITKAHCNMDTIYFPFDKHRCQMNFTLLTHTVNEAVLLPEGHDALTLHDSDTYESGVWQVGAEPVHQGLISLCISQDPHSLLTMTLILERKPQFFIYNVIYPAVVIMAMCLLSLFLPNNTGEKMVFTVSILVAMNFFQQFLLKISFPTGEGIPLLGQLFGAGFTLAAISVVCGVLTLRLHFKGTVEPGNLPDTSLVKHLAKVTRMERYVKDLISTEPRLLSKTPRCDHTDTENIFTISRPGKMSQVNIGELQNGTTYKCRKRLNASVGNSLSGIVSNVTELKNMYTTQSKEEEVADRTKSAWELVAVMFQRVAAVGCAVGLLLVVAGIYLQLAFRTDH